MFHLEMLEHPSHPILGPNLRGLRLFGLLKRKSQLVNNIHTIFFIISSLFVITEVIEFCILSQRGEFNTIMDNLSLTTVCIMCIIKMGTFRLWYRRWCDVISVVSAVEIKQSRNPRPEDEKIIKEYFTYCRKVNYFFWGVAFFTIVSVIVKPLLIKSIFSSYYASYELSMLYPFSVWMPFETTTSLEYWVVFAAHTVIGLYLAGCLAVWDTTVVSLMIFFRGQLELLRNECMRIAGADAEAVTEHEMHERIARCHRHHILILKYSKVFGGIISAAMFIYFIICSIMICAIALQITSSTLVDRGVYESKWPCCGVRTCREMALLGAGLRLPVVFNAGPCNQMTIATFTAILKASYSYFALLKSKASH